MSIEKVTLSGTRPDRQQLLNKVVIDQKRLLVSVLVTDSDLVLEVDKTVMEEAVNMLMDLTQRCRGCQTSRYRPELSEYTTPDIAAGVPLAYGRAIGMSCLRACDESGCLLYNLQGA